MKTPEQWLPEFLMACGAGQEDSFKKLCGEIQQDAVEHALSTLQLMGFKVPTKTDSVHENPPPTPQRRTI